MAKIKMTIKQNKAYYSNLGKLMREDVEDYLAVAVQSTETEAIQAAPVDMGFLRASGYSEIDGLEGVVGFKAHYAPYVEFGTGGLVDVPSGLEEYAIKWKGQGIKQVNLPPRPFLYPAWKKNGLKFLENLEKMLNNGTKQGN